MQIEITETNVSRRRTSGPRKVFLWSSAKQSRRCDKEVGDFLISLASRMNRRAVREHHEHGVTYRIDLPISTLRLLEGAI